MKRISFIGRNTLESMHRGHFFDKGSMRFFNSRIAEYGYNGILCNDKETIYSDLVFFVTSEKFDYKSPRLYTIRRLNRTTGEIITVGEFQAYKTSSGANKKAQKLAMESI